MPLTAIENNFRQRLDASRQKGAEPARFLTQHPYLSAAPWGNPAGLCFAGPRPRVARNRDRLGDAVTPCRRSALTETAVAKSRELAMARTSTPTSAAAAAAVGAASSRIGTGPVTAARSRIAYWLRAGHAVTVRLQACTPDLRCWPKSAKSRSLVDAV